MSKILFGEILDPDPAESAKIEADEKRVRAGFWKTLRKAAKRIPFMEDLVAAYYCALDPATPARSRAILLGALAYFVLPLDWIPDFIMGFGFTDDMAVLAAAIQTIRVNLQPRHYDAARTALDEENDSRENG